MDVSSDEDPVAENAAVASLIVLSSDESDDDNDDVVVVGETRAPQSSQDDSDDVVFVSMQRPASPSKTVGSTTDRSSVECVELCASPVKAVLGDNSEGGTDITTQLSDDSKDEVDGDLTTTDGPINLVKVPTQNKSILPGDATNRFTSSPIPISPGSPDISQSTASSHHLTKPALPFNHATLQPVVSGHSSVIVSPTCGSSMFYKPGSESLSFKNWLLPGSDGSQACGVSVGSVDINDSSKADLFTTCASSKPVLHKSLSFTPGTSTASGAILTGDYTDYQHDQSEVLSKNRFINELLALDDLSLPGTSGTRSDSTYNLSPGPRVKRMKSDGQLAEKAMPTPSMPSTWNTKCVVCGEEGRKVSCCMQRHQTCSMCLEERVKNVLCGQIEGQLKCLAQACDSFYPMSELKHSLPPMVVEILETRLEKSYVDYLADIMMKDAPDEGKGEGKGNPLLLPPPVQEPMEVTSGETNQNAFEFPPTWDKMEPQTPYLMVELEPESTEYISVALKFHESMMFPRSDIEKIFRVQNPILWKFYSVKKQQMILDNDGLLVDDLLLFHGTGNDAIEAICKSGFDWRLCGKNGTMYGQGSYFAKGASYSHQYCTRSSALSNTLTAKQKSLQYRLKRALKTRAKLAQNQSQTSISNPTVSGMNPLSVGVNVQSGSAMPSVTVSSYQQFINSIVSSNSLSAVMSSSYQPMATIMAGPNNTTAGVCPNVSVGPSTGLGPQTLSGTTFTSAALNSHLIASPSGPVAVQVPPNMVWSGSSTGSGVGLLPVNTGSAFTQFSVSFPTMVALPLAAPLNLSTNTNTTNSTNPLPTSSSGAPPPSPGVQVPPLIPAPPPVQPISLPPRKKLQNIHQRSAGVHGSNSSVTFAPNVYGYNPGLVNTSTLPELPQDNVPTYRMFLAKVLVGKFTGGNSSLRKPPPLNPCADPYGKCYDSCVDNVFNPSIYVIFDLAQAYPEYIVQYKMNF